MRSALLRSLAFVLLCGCSSPRVLSSPNLPVESETSEAPSDTAKVQREVSETLGRVERAMTPICEGKCGTVGAVPDLDLESGAGTIPSVRGYASLVLYRPDGSCVRETEEVRFYCMAHEYGHHLDVAMSEQRSRYDWAGELRADALAGCALSRAGVSLKRLEARFDSWMSAEHSRFAMACGTDDRHPALEWTWKAIEAGAAACAGAKPTKAAILDAVEPIIQKAHETARRERKRLVRAAGTEPCLAPLR
jgi:hypothetical protein